MRLIPILWAIALAAIFILPAQAEPQAHATLEHHRIYGRVEMALVTDHRIKMRVRMDTGAKTSSLSATHIEEFEKEDKKWVRFTVEPGPTGKHYQVEAPLVRHVKIKKRVAEIDQNKADVKYEVRPTVMIPVCLGSQQRMVEVSLADRSHFFYRMLLGRSGMEEFDILIDPSRIFTVKPTCKISTAAEKSS
jgi:hypothetical protein